VRILVTGHDGYVGAVLTGMLRQAGHDVEGLDTGFFAGCGLAREEEPARVGKNGTPGGNGPAGRNRIDLRDVGVPELGGFHAVIHLAALSNDPLGSLDPALTRAINQDGSVQLAARAKAAGVSRFLFASSCSLYGTSGAERVEEDAPMRPLTPYGISKMAMEVALSGLADDGFSPTYLRAATAYGVSPRLRGDVVVNNLVGSAVTRGEVRLLSDGKSWRPLLHVEDMCRAFVAALEAPREAVHKEAFNVVPEGENYQVREVAELVAAQVPGCQVTIAKDGGEPDPRSYRVDGGKLLSAVPEFRPRRTLAEGIGDLFSAISQAGVTEEDFFGPRFIRLVRLQELRRRGFLDQDLRWVNGSRTRSNSGVSQGVASLPTPPAAR